MPATNTSFGVSEEVEAYIRVYLQKILSRSRQRAESGTPVSSTEDALEDGIGRLVMSSMRESKQKFSIEYLKRGLRSIGCMRDALDIVRTIGYMCRFNIPTILSMGVIPHLNSKGQKTYHFKLDIGSVGLPDASYYAASVPGKSDVLFAYTNLFKHIAKQLDTDDFSVIIPTESRIAGFIKGYKENSTVEHLSFGDLRRRFSKIPWSDLFAAYGHGEMRDGILIQVESIEWIAYIEKSLTEIPLDQWYMLFTAHTALHALPYLPHPFDTWHFDLFQRLLRGQRQKTTQEELTLEVVKTKMSAALGYFFVKEHLTPEFHEQSTQFIKTIIDAAARRVNSTNWLSPATRRRAAEKLRAVTVSAAYSEQLVASPPRPPNLQTDNFLANIYLLEAAATDEQLARLRLRPGEIRLDKFWDEPPYTVNAYYYNDTNQIVIPAGSFFWPFFNDAHHEWLGWNYGGLGAIIAHELTHGFDEEGKEFDEKGQERAWWTAADQRHYKEKTAALVRLFDQAKVLGRPVNGAATLNENLADLGGLGIALDALKSAMHSKGLSAEQQLHHLRQFFNSYAVSWRTKERPERVLQRLILDKHAPVELRVNLIVCHFDEWYDAFGVRTEDELYIPPEERIRIF
jgi:putative endopeptidase